MAEHHRNYEAPAQWRHDENVLVNAVRAKTYERNAAFLGMLVTCIFLVRRVRVEWRIRPRNILSYVPATPFRRAEQPGSPAVTRINSSNSIAAIMRERDKYDNNEEKGEIGQSAIREVLRPLVESGWRILGEKVPVTFDDRTTVDIDFVVRSPRGNGFCIDAKNIQASVEYRSGKNRLDHQLIFRYSRFRTPPDPYPIAQALESADWAHRQIEYAFSSDSKMYALMCFLENERLSVMERNAYGLHLVRRRNLSEKLLALDSAWPPVAIPPAEPIDVASGPRTPEKMLMLLAVRPIKTSGFCAMCDSSYANEWTFDGKNELRHLADRSNSLFTHLEIEQLREALELGNV